MFIGKTFTSNNSTGEDEYGGMFDGHVGYMSAIDVFGFSPQDVPRLRFEAPVDESRKEKKD